MDITDTSRERVPESRPPFKAQRLHGWSERRAMLRWVALLALGVVGLPFYGGILQVAETFLNQPMTLFWPLLGVTIPYSVACWLVLRSFPAASSAARWIEFGLILAPGFVALAIFWGAPPTISHDA